MTYYKPYATPQGFRFRCCMNSKSEPFDSSKQCREAAATEERRDRWIAKQLGLRGEIYRAAFEQMNGQSAGTTPEETA